MRTCTEDLELEEPRGKRDGVEKVQWGRGCKGEREELGGCKGEREGRRGGVGSVPGGRGRV